MGYREIPIGTETCLGCNGVVEEGTAICPACGAPIDIGHFAELELKLKPHIGQARTALGVATMLFALCLVLLFAVDAPSSTLVTAAFGTLLFGGCCVMSLRRPLAASVSALAVFSALQIAVIAQGRLWILLQGSVVVALKVILFVLLVGGVKAGLRIRDIRRESRPRDRQVAAGIIAATLGVGIALGLWVRHQEVAAYQDDGPPDTMDAVRE
jgi:hypothetical protein